MTPDFGTFREPSMSSTPSRFAGTMARRVALALLILLPDVTMAAEALRKNPPQIRTAKGEKKPARATLGKAATREAKTGTVVPAAKPVRTTPASRKKPDPVIDAVLSEAEIFDHFNVDPKYVGYMVMDLDSGQKLAAHNDHDLFIPASVAKVPTTVAALQVLGPDYRYETGLYLDNVPGMMVSPPENTTPPPPVDSEGKNGNGRDIVDHVFQVNGVTPEQIAAGNLYLKGGGDPFLSTSDLMALASKLKKMGITRWTGGFYYDTSLLATPDRIDTVQEDDASYNPGISALSVDFNRYIFSWTPAKSIRGVSEVTTTPNLPSTDIHRSLQQLGWNVDVLPSKPWEGIRIQSPPQPSGSVWLPVRDAGYHTALLFQKLCSNKGVELPMPVKRVMPETTTPIIIHQSQPLIKLVGQTLEHSNNLMAELIGMTTSRQITGKALSLKNSSTSLLKWYQESLPQVNWQGFHLENHSGLSSKSQLTPEQMTTILRFADSQSFKDKPYVSLLPISGWTGTLARRLGDHMTAMKVWAKTGTIHYSSGLAGYLYTQTKKRLVFSIFVTNYPEREQLTRLISHNQSFPEARAKNWNRRAKAVEDALVRRWIRQY